MRLTIARRADNSVQCKVRISSLSTPEHPEAFYSYHGGGLSTAAAATTMRCGEIGCILSGMPVTEGTIGIVTVNRAHNHSRHECPTLLLNKPSVGEAFYPESFGSRHIRGPDRHQGKDPGIVAPNRPDGDPSIIST